MYAASVSEIEQKVHLNMSVPKFMPRCSTGVVCVQLPWRRVVALVAIASFISSACLAESSLDEEPAEKTSSGTASEEPIDWEQVGLTALDVVVLRPLGVVTIAGGFGIFLVSVPFVAPSGNTLTAWDVFVYGSYDDTFVRPLGEI